MEYLVLLATFNHLLMILTSQFVFIKTTRAALRFQLVNNEQSDYVDIKQQELHVAKGVDLKINCLYSSSEETSLKINRSQIFWQGNERRFENHNKSISQYLSILHIDKVWWKGKQTFCCVFKGFTDNSEVVKNKSLEIISGDKPEFVPEPSIEWIEGEVDITWIPISENDTMTTNYTVEYLVPAQSQHKIILTSFCGLFALKNCSNKIEFYCRALFLPQLMTDYNVKLVAENKFGKTVGRNFIVKIPLSQQRMMLKPVKDLKVFLTNAGVTIKWRDVSYYKETKKVWYKCQDSLIIHKNVTNSVMYEISKDKLPAFTYCKFCVSRQRYQGGQFSCDKCKVIQTAEDIPKAIPKLKSCQHSSCPVVFFGLFKNVTISWRLPHKRLWNGDISRQLIFYYEQNERVLKNISINDSNVTEWTLENLTTSRGYHAFMIICTHAGCGGKSNVIYIPGSLASTVSFEFQLLSDKANTGLVVGLTLGILGLCFSFIFVFLYIKRHSGEILPPIEEPRPEQDLSQVSPTNEAEYDLLEWRNSRDL